MHPSLRFSPLSIAGLLALTLPLTPIAVERALAQSNDAAYRARERDYVACAAELVSTGILEAEAAAICARALAPRDVGECVADIYDNTDLESAAIAAGCRQVRRPVEFASCVVEISTSTAEAAEVEVLDNCRRSLLPSRFSNCVVGLSEATELTIPAAMSSCIAAGDRPTNLLPSFVPSSQGIPTTPRSSFSTEGENAEEATPLRFTQPLVPYQP